MPGTDRFQVLHRHEVADPPRPQGRDERRGVGRVAQRVADREEDAGPAHDLGDAQRGGLVRGDRLLDEQVHAALGERDGGVDVVVVLGRDHDDVDEVRALGQVGPPREPGVLRDVAGVGQAFASLPSRLGDRRHEPARQADVPSVQTTPAAGADDPDPDRT